MMGTVILVMGSFVAYAGWRGRTVEDTENVYPRISGFETGSVYPRAIALTVLEHCGRSQRDPHLHNHE